MRFYLTPLLSALLLSFLLVSPHASASDTWSLEYNATCFTPPYDTYENFIDQFVQRNTNPRYDRAYFERIYPAAQFQSLRTDFDCRWLVYRNGTAYVGGFAVFPREFSGKDDGAKLPVIIYNRAGHGPTHGVSFADIFQRIFPLAEAGFMVIGSQYRGGGGVFSGMSNGTDEYGGRDLSDVLRLPQVAEAVGPADAERVGLYGRARGSMMSFMAARARPSAFKALASAATVSDLGAWIDEWDGDHAATRYIPDFTENETTALQARSVIEWADELSSDLPILLIHGQRDWNLPATQSEALSARLNELGHSHELLLWSHADHQFTNYRSDLTQALIDFFSTHLK
ncbi:alpha/beta hydrolase family protein [Aliidiomarina sanyensis]|uniref:Peptidase S9 prolyl oligopeptidase catalytic domain-containing protein n=1 Tax=Aliidiomarina sanyensis TaxID=1249555 RepID=A0A432WPP9_9GAMM|nr:prolyl oligopeptidase family serine peptidase [Aliidiomarina sanyensis]RUO35718.1 hypothetical protein CWE11_02865 [Aliidiomarina sanyensis]